MRNKKTKKLNYSRLAKEVAILVSNGGASSHFDAQKIVEKKHRLTSDQSRALEVKYFFKGRSGAFSSRLRV